MLFAIQFILLFAFTVAVFTFVKKKWIAALLSILFSLFITLQFVSYFLIGNLIDYRFYENSNLNDVWLVRGFYTKEILLGALLFIVLSLLLYLLHRFLKPRKTHIWAPLLILLFGIVGMTLPDGGIVDNLANIYSIKTTKTKTFDRTLQDLNIDPKTYVRADDITAEPGKNIIVISLESYEKGYLMPPMDKLTPHLNSLVDQFSYYDMNQNIGSDWTAASIYTSLTGVPSFFRSPKNQVFQNARVENIGNLGKVLQKAGYDMTYMMGKKEFSGLNNLLTHFGFEVKSEKDLDIPKMEGFFWGMQDKELFEQATQEILAKSKLKKPYAIFLNNISGHFPHGIYDERLEGTYPKQDTKLEFMAAAVDDFIGTMIETLERENALDNTVFYIYPDHQFMGRLDRVIKNFPKERRLFVISNASEAELQFDPKKPITQIDLPRLIINGAQIKTNATFLTDYLKGKDKPKFVRKNVSNFISLNEPLVQQRSFQNEIRLVIDEEKTLTISQEANFNKKVVNIEEGKLYRIYFDENMNFIKCADVREKEAFWKSPTVGLLFSVKGERIFSYLLKGKKIGVARQGDEEIVFTKNDIDIFDDWALIQPEKIFDPNMIYLNSVGYNAKAYRGDSYIKTRAENHRLQRGLNVLTIEDNVYLVENFDTHESKKDSKAFVKTITRMLASRKPFAVVADDSAETMLRSYEDELNTLGFNKLTESQIHGAYVGYSNEYGKIIEKVDEKSVEIELPVKQFPRKDISALRDDITRYIAHAGGKIDGKIYTNSLEALNLNYEKGFRYFELDILETTDNRLVAAHDWKSWAEKTGYKGDLPPSENIFKAQKIFQKYTPLNMTDINNWFAEHPDAILVTDKIDDPIKMVSAFRFKDRLMMELFSVEAIEKANPLGIKGVMASNNIVRKFKGNEIEKLKELDVRYLAVSRQFAAENKVLFNKLKDAGIKTYVFKINYEKGKNEEYVFNYEIGLIYGMYADQWTFPSEANKIQNSAPASKEMAVAKN